MKLKRRLTKFVAMAAITYYLDPQLGSQRRRDLRRHLERLRASIAEQKAKRTSRGGPVATDDDVVDAIVLTDLERTDATTAPVVDLTVPRAV